MHVLNGMHLAPAMRVHCPGQVGSGTLVGPSSGSTQARVSVPVPIDPGAGGYAGGRRRRTPDRTGSFDERRIETDGNRPDYELGKAAEK